jgi:phosphoserine phosphatase
VVGDGANDELMLGQAGLSIAYNAKKALDRVANAVLEKTRLSKIALRTTGVSPWVKAPSRRLGIVIKGTMI